MHCRRELRVDGACSRNVVLEEGAIPLTKIAVVESPRVVPCAAEEFIRRLTQEERVEEAGSVEIGARVNGDGVLRVPLLEDGLAPRRTTIALVWIRLVVR